MVDDAPSAPAEVTGTNPEATPAASVAGTDLPPGYVWAYPPQPEPEKPWKAPRWLLILTIVWAVFLAVSGTIYALHGKPTVREQTTIPTSEKTVDAAISNVVGASGNDPIVVIGSFVKSQSCNITPVRGGVEYVRSVDLFTPPGTESFLLKTIAAGLPKAYGAKAGPGNVLTLYADAGDYVGLVGAVPSPGDVQIKAETGCREVGEKLAPVVAPKLGSVELQPIQAVLTALGGTATTTAAAEVPCPFGGSMLRTVTEHIPSTGTPYTLSKSLALLAPKALMSTPNLVAYRAGTIDIVTSQDVSGVTIASTSRCAP